MTKGRLREDDSWRGFWWLPEDPETTYPGFLKFDPEKGLDLTLIGGFDQIAWEEDGLGTRVHAGETRGFPVIHGLCAGDQKVTLLDAFSVDGTTFGLGFRGGPSEQTIHASQALTGVHLSDPQEEVFSGLQCAIEDTLSWSGSDAITAEMRWDGQRNRLTGDATITLRAVDALTTKVGGIEYSLSHTLTLPSYDHTRAGTRARVGDTPIFSLTSTENASLQSLTNHMHALVDLLALATGRNPAVLWTTLQRPSGHETCPCAETFPWKDPHVRSRHGIPHQPEECPEVRPRQVGLYYRGRGTGDPDAKSVDAHNVVFTLDDIPFSSVLPKWLEVREKFQAACNILISARYSQDAYVEASALTSVAAAEAFHKALAEPNPTPPDVMEDLVAKAVEAMPEDRKEWIKQVIPRGHSLRERLNRLAERMPDSCRERLLPDAVEWAKAAQRTRNSLSHSGKSEANVRLLDAVMRVTRAVVLVNILLELGLSEDRILQALTYNKELSGACALARKHLSKTPAAIA